MTITSANNGQTFKNYRISTTSGDCVRINGASNVTIENFNIGPCGTNDTTSSSNGIEVQGGSAIGIYDSYIHVENLASDCCDTHDGIFIMNGSSDIVQGNVLAFNETNIEIDAASSGVVVNGNFLLNPTGPFPRGQQVQTGGSNITVENNRALSCQIGGPAHSGVVKPLYCNASTLAGAAISIAADQEDALNFYQATTFTVSGNWVEGGDSPSGQGILVDSGSNGATIQNNTLKDTGQGCIGPLFGSGTVSGNKCLSMTDIDVDQNGIYPFGSSCGTWHLSNNRISVLGFSSGSACNPNSSSCMFNSYGQAGNCTVIDDGGNIFDDDYPAPVGGPGSGSAYAALAPIVTTNPPPLIPPLPKNCVAKSPYSTQTSKPGC